MSEEENEPQPAEPSSSDSLLEEYAKALAVFEDEFKDRYTESDPNFQSYLKKEGDSPPIVDNFFSRPSYRDGDHRNRDHRQGQKRRYDDRRHHGGGQRYHGGGQSRRYDERHQPYQERRSYDRHSHHDSQGHYYRDQRPWNQQRRSGPDGWT